MFRTALIFALLISGCSGGSDEPAEPDAFVGPSEFTITNTDASGEVHRLTITCEDLESETAITLTTDGDHQHTIRLEVVDLQNILAGEAVTVTFTDGHEHSFTIVKPADACVSF